MLRSRIFNGFPFVKSLIWKENICFVISKSVSRLISNSFICKTNIMADCKVREKDFLSVEEASKLRIDYVNAEFNEDGITNKDPLSLFDVWFKEAMARDDIKEVNAMTISTCGRDLRPMSRIVLLKGYDKRGFRFFTNYDSRKGKAIDENPNVSLSFFWEPLHRQVLIQGVATKLHLEESTEYFHSRPRGSQIGALVSKQSTVLPGRHVLQKKEAELKKKYEDETVPIPKPDYWGGYIVSPYFVEFWSGRQSRLHDRIAFRLPSTNEHLEEHTYKGNDGWVYERLSP